jgi:protein-disulfide isomerase
MTEEFNHEVGLPSADMQPPAARTSEREKFARRAWVAPGWFLMGIIVGLVIAPLFIQSPAKPQLDIAAIRKAAHDGALDAINTLHAPINSGQAQRQETPASITKDALIVREANRLGDKTAKVMIVEFGDFQCPFCGQFHTTISRNLIDSYIKTGQASFVYKHMAFLGSESIWAAVASECAADQGKFWPYHDLLFERQNGENRGAFAKDILLGFARELQLDLNRFTPCLQNEQTLKRVQADTEEAQTFGVNSTPTFFINGQPMIGALPLDKFKQLIDKALAQ